MPYIPFRNVLNRRQAGRKLFPTIFFFLFLSLTANYAELSLAEQKAPAEKENPTLLQEVPQEKIQHQVSVTLKLIQVYVTDKKGNPITDLEKSDFEVLDNGQKKLLTEFEKHTRSFLIEEKEEESGPTSQSAGASLNRKFFFLFDFVYNNQKGLRATRKAALYFLDRIAQPADEIGLITYSLEGGLAIREFLTTDHSKIRRFVENIGLKNYQSSVENLEARYWQQVNDENPLDVRERGAVGAGIWSKPEKDPIMDLPNISEEMKRAFITGESRIQALTFIREMTKLARALGYVPGIKHLILFSAGIPYSLIYGIQVEDPSRGTWRQDWGQTQIQHYLEDLQKQISHANLVVYALDTEDSLTRINQDIRLTGVLTLEKIASYSGGKYFGNVNNFSRALNEVQKITACYYVLGYYVDEKWDGDYHEIKVRVKRPGLKVYAQKGYFNPRPFNELSDLEKQLHLVDLCLSEKPLLQEPLPLEGGSLSYFEGSQEKLVLWARLVRKELANLAGQKMELLFVIFDSDNNLVKLERKKVKLGSLPENGLIYFSSPLELKPGEYKLRMVMRNLESGRAALGTASLVMVKPQESGLLVGQPALARSSRNEIYQNLPPFLPVNLKNLTLAGNQIEPGSSELFALVSCSFPGLENPELEIKSIILQAEGKGTRPLFSDLKLLEIRRQEGLVSCLAKIETESLAAGNYIIYFHLTDRKSGLRAARSLMFQVGD